jgi:hypothetical protein
LPGLTTKKPLLVAGFFICSGAFTPPRML